MHAGRSFAVVRTEIRNADGSLVLEAVSNHASRKRELNAVDAAAPVVILAKAGSGVLTRESSSLIGCRSLAIPCEMRDDVGFNPQAFRPCVEKPMSAYSGFAPEALTTFSHFLISDLM